MQLVERLKEAGEDFEWYPTTDEIIQAVVDDIRTEDRYASSGESLLDVGAGDGRVLIQIQQKLSDDSREFRNHYVKLFAIEKSTIHLSAMPKEIVILGTDFHHQTLVDKQVRYVFSNPPYSEFEQWTVKLIRESAASVLYLVIPRRWKDSTEIKRAIEIRGATVESLGEFDFENAERKARAKVDLLRVYFRGDRTDAFDSILEEMMPELQAFDRDGDLEESDDDESRACEIAEGSENLIDALVMAYDAEVAALIENYRSAAKIKIKILAELGVSKSSILLGIREKITGLKNKYWKTLFDRFAPITTRLATKQRKAFLDSLNGKAAIDFTESNIYSMLIWVTKWANDYFDQQLIDLFKSMTSQCSIANYKSNMKTWGKSGWRYNRHDVLEHTCYKLEYRMVLEHCGGICSSEWSWKRDQHRGLRETAFELVADCVTIANNLGFPCLDSPRNYRLESNKQNKIMLDDGEVLVAVRAFKNGNLHMHFNQRVMLAINVEAGRLLGWLKSPQEAVDELKVTGDDEQFVKDKFGASFRIAPSNICRISFDDSTECSHAIQQELF
jgi:hypothetical protein